MSKFIFSRFYGFPIQKAAAIMAILPFAWAWINQFFTNKMNMRIIWKIGNLFLSFGIVAVIIAATLHSRGGVSDVVLTPFYSLVEIQNSPDLGRSMFMNIFLFFPLGLTLPFALPEKWNRRALITILFSMVLSITIECLQYHYHLGRAETDDVICNTLGAIIGTLSYILSRKFNTK